MAATTVSFSEPLLLHMDALPAGTRLAEFELLGLLGIGGFGMVYRAYDHSLQRPVAIKEYMPSALAGRAAGMSVSMRSSVDQQSFVAGLKSFMAEARLLAQFDHPSLVKVFRVWEANNTAYMVMPFYNGVTLKQARAQMRSPPPEEWLRKVMWSVLEALRLLHAHSTVHRDVSPDNIFLQDFGPPVLLDLGAARRAIGDKTQRHTAILKVNYAPIEQYADAEDMRQGPWTDLYSLAAVVHGCLCNDAPEPATFRVLRDRMPSMASVAHTVHQQFGVDYSPAFVQAVAQALAIRPNDRPQSAAAFADLLALRAPLGMESFDWRSELGYIWVPPGNAEAAANDAAASTVPAEEQTQWAGPGPETTQLFPPSAERDFAATDIDVASPAAAQLPERAATVPAPPVRQARPPRSRVVWGVGLAVIAALAGLYVLVLREPALADGSTFAAALAPIPVASTAAPQIVAPAAAPEPAAGALPEPTPALQAASSPALPPPRTTATESDARTLAAKTSVPARSAVASSARASSSPSAGYGMAAAMPALPLPRSEPRVEVAAGAPVTASRSEPTRPQARVSLSAAEICPDSNFLSRPMCLFRECQKSQFAGMQICIDNNARLQNNNRQQSP